MSRLTGVKNSWLARRIPIVWAQLGVLLAVLFAAPFALDVDPDFWWHLRTGELIWHDGIPHNDPFSWTASGQAWTAHEWLSEALIYGVQSVGGYAVNAGLFGAFVLVALLLAALSLPVLHGPALVPVAAAVSLLSAWMIGARVWVMRRG